MATEKQLFINSVRQIRIQGSAVVPTSVLYEGQKCYVGVDATARAGGAAELKEDFKVEIGNDTPIKLAKRNADKGRSTLGIAKDFIDSVLNNAISSIEMQGFKIPTRILVAEPLSLKDDLLAHEQWLQNYRKSLKGILAGRFPEVDFMPEPFAVFQFYRYGIRHALVAQRQKHVALVFDFGGGTFDASVIETTASGDISQSGRNSKPLAARSIPFGGFAINRIIADSLQRKILDRHFDKATLGKAREKYTELKNLDDEELQSHRIEFAAFTRNYRRLLQSVEQAKIAVCSAITNWRLDADLTSSSACPVDVPVQPLKDNSPSVPVRLEPTELRQLFEMNVWRASLLPAIRETLKSAARELDGKPISIVLLSGGSSNFRWIKPLVQRDLGEQLGNAEILELNENFQEIVAKGLAVECARRFYTEGGGDFRAVTYNRLCLVLSPNGSGLELKRFVPESAELGDLSAEPGVLLPSSTSLRGLTGKPLRWKVRLDLAPVMPPFMGRVCSGYAPQWGVLQTPSV